MAFQKGSPQDRLIPTTVGPKVPCTSWRRTGKTDTGDRKDDPHSPGPDVTELTW